MVLHHLELFRSELAGLEQDVVRDTDLSEIVKRRGSADQFGFVPCVVAVLGRERETVDGLDLGFVQIVGSLVHLLLGHLVLVPQNLMYGSRLEQVGDAQNHLGRIERLGEEILGTPRENAFCFASGESSAVSTRIGR